MSPRRKRRLVAIGALAAIVAVVAIALVFRQPPSSRDPEVFEGEQMPPVPDVVPPEPSRVTPTPMFGASAYDSGQGPDSFPSRACSLDNPNKVFVATNGDDTNSGSEERPLRTISSAVAALPRAAALFIRGGTYYNRSADGHEDNLISIDSRSGGTPDSWLTVCGYPGERPKLVANNTDAGAVYVARSSYVHIEGLELIGPAKGLSASPLKGSDSKGVWIGHFPYFDSEASHVRVWNNWIHGFGASGIQLNLSNNVDIRGNHIWDNAHWSDFATSGISSFWPSAGNGNDANGYGLYIVGNLLWDNYMSDTLYDANSAFGLTDGNCIIIDEHANYTDVNRSRTLIKNNVCVANGGTGVAMTRSGNADIVRNTFFRNNKTALPTVVNHGEFMCQSAERAVDVGGRKVLAKCTDVRFADNVVVAREERKSPPLVRFGDTSLELSGNIWIKSNFEAPDGRDLVRPNGTQVLAKPDDVQPPSGDWTTVGPAAGKGAAWPLEVKG